MCVCDCIYRLRWLSDLSVLDFTSWRRVMAELCCPTLRNDSADQTVDELRRAFCHFHNQHRVERKNCTQNRDETLCDYPSTGNETTRCLCIAVHLSRRRYSNDLKITPLDSSKFGRHFASQELILHVLNDAALNHQVP